MYYKASILGFLSNTTKISDAFRVVLEHSVLCDLQSENRSMNRLKSCVFDKRFTLGVPIEPDHRACLLTETFPKYKCGI